VALRTMHTNQGWILVFVVTEATQEILVAQQGQAPVGLGVGANINIQTGRPMANSMLNLPEGTPKQVLQVSYRDGSGALRGPFPIPFDPEVALNAATKEMLEATATSWLSFREYEGRRLMYWSQIASNRCGLAEVRYGLNAAAPDRVLAMPACDPAAPGEIRGFQPMLEVPRDTRFATMQLRYRDGTQSRVVRFEAP
jgi:hypothetical protein